MNYKDIAKGLFEIAEQQADIVNQHPSVKGQAKPNDFRVYDLAIELVAEGERLTLRGNLNQGDLKDARYQFARQREMLKAIMEKVEALKK